MERVVVNVKSNYFCEIFLMHLISFKLVICKINIFVIISKVLVLNL